MGSEKILPIEIGLWSAPLAVLQLVLSKNKVMIKTIITTLTATARKKQGV